ncbi:hypothetical protein ACLKA6_006372 [Drosophila palustris]
MTNLPPIFVHHTNDVTNQETHRFPNHGIIYFENFLTPRTRKYLHKSQFFVFHDATKEKPTARFPPNRLKSRENIEHPVFVTVQQRPSQSDYWVT